MKQSFWCYISCILMLANVHSFGQQRPNPIGEARSFVQNKEYNKALEIYAYLYKDAPFDKGIYSEYLQTLDSAKEYDQALALTKNMTEIRRDDPVIFVDQGNVYLLKGDKKSANESFDKAIAKLNGFELQIKEVANAFSYINEIDYAIKTYQKGREVAHQPTDYATELALLYNKKGDTQKAIDNSLDVLYNEPGSLEQVQSGLLQIVGNDPQKSKLLQKALEKRLKGERAQSITWSEMLTWMYTSKGDYKQALTSLEQADKGQNNNGDIILNFARTSLAAGKTDIALDAITYLLSKPNSNVDKDMLLRVRLNLLYQQITNIMPPDQNLVNQYLSNFDSIEKQNPASLDFPFIHQKGEILSLYAGKPAEAIKYLQFIVDSTRLSAEDLSYAKLDLGDYNIITGNVWTAALLYSQVDKSNKENAIGEDARFRNAKLSYYRGDFDWAKGQLKVLKASTSELIANDALNLSVMLTENTPADSNYGPLKSFADADLLLFQHKTNEAHHLLDSLAASDPEGELQDDILMAQAKIMIMEGKSPDAINYLNTIVDKYSNDVLADDAIMQLANIYEHKLNDSKKALSYYEKLLTDYPASTFTQKARERYNALKKNQNS